MCVQAIFIKRGKYIANLIFFLNSYPIIEKEKDNS